ncbi:MAG: FmdB family zinc ribbon protein [Gammaproteobacteria bacterium]
MPVYQLLCPDCGHRFSGMVFAGTREPEKWVCAECGGDRAQRLADSAPVPHPLEVQREAGCPYCSGLD